MTAPKHLATKNLFRLDVSGGAGAVGTCVGGAILESGADVVLVDIAKSPAQESWDQLIEIATANGTKATYSQLNVQDEASITSALAAIRPSLRHPIRGLVSCAAISGESDACMYPVDIFRRILDVNTVGTFLMTRAIASEMHRTNVEGSIVLIASMSGHVSNKGINTSAYNASKAAVHQLARSLAAEWGHPQNTFPGSTATETNPNPSNGPRTVYPAIRVNTLSPGHIDTPLSEAARLRGLTDEWARQNMLGRISLPEEFRGPVLFLLADASSYMTGADLRVDGGHCAW
ncbi:hypothetical protein FB567DRAFT_564539 [Paraphoma chrysanthemicola]|uniref:Uncharacterized protein n=1 Tax=Paraphoma chrysanthemicola TaxID=798071 RepID=A0A8K0QV18_9PLEO|nr:hypothetical protein FB567DRAFT_564539 [Paraphoma chrysanthemicola]